MFQPSVQEAMVAVVPQLRAFALKLCKNTGQADELVQETMLRGCKSIGTFQPGTNMVGWLTTILRNEFYTQHRRAKYRATEPIDDFANVLAIPAAQPIDLEVAELRAALNQLPTKERSSLLLTLGCGYSYEETAALCGCPVGTIKSQVNRARKKVIARLTGDDDVSATDRHRSSREPEAVAV